MQMKQKFMIQFLLFLLRLKLKSYKFILQNDKLFKNCPPKIFFKSFPDDRGYEFQIKKHLVLLFRNKIIV